jgi:hypothetical protein
MKSYAGNWQINRYSRNWRNKTTEQYWTIDRAIPDNRFWIPRVFIGPAVILINLSVGISFSLCYTVNIWPCDLEFWPCKSIGFQTLLRTKYVPSLVKIHWRMLILVFTRMLRKDGRTDGRKRYYIPSQLRSSNGQLKKFLFLVTAAILNGKRGCRTQFWKGSTQGPSLPGLV